MIDRFFFLANGSIGSFLQLDHMANYQIMTSLIVKINKHDYGFQLSISHWKEKILMPHLVLIQLNNNMRFQSFVLVISPTPRNLSPEFFFFSYLEKRNYNYKYAKSCHVGEMWQILRPYWVFKISCLFFVCNNVATITIFLKKEK